MAGCSPRQHAEPVVGPFSMTNEEKDIGEFRAYLLALAPEALWDVLSHLNADRYPRRREAVLREMARRDLFFIVPYTRRELQIRAFLGLAVFVAVLAVALKVIGAFAVHISPYERLPFFTDLAIGGPRAARMLFPFMRALARAGAAGTTIVVVFAGFSLLRRRIRGDIALMAVTAGLLIGLLLFLLQ